MIACGFIVTRTINPYAEATMSQITIDRELLQRVLDAYFQEWADARAHLGLAQKLDMKRPDAGRQYFDIHKQEATKELSQDAGNITRLRETLRDGDDEAFVSVLKARFPAPSYPVRRPRTGR
jgi:hypothetical protein